MKDEKCWLGMLIPLMLQVLPMRDNLFSLLCAFQPPQPQQQHHQNHRQQNLCTACRTSSSCKVNSAPTAPWVWAKNPNPHVTHGEAMPRNMYKMATLGIQKNKKIAPILFASRVIKKNHFHENHNEILKN